MCISVNCIIANQLIISTEQRVLIYDQILLALPANYEDSFKIGAWCSISGEKIIGPILFWNAVYSRTYVNNILAPFFRELTHRERDFALFQQDSATAHTADISMREIERVFHE